MSAPEATCASAMTACDGYLPVPTTSREPNVRPAMMRGSEFMMLVQADGRRADNCPNLRLPGLREASARAARRHPPPTKLTISISSPSFTIVVS